MIERFSKVKVINNSKRILSDSMISWIEEHSNKIYKVERVVDGCAKLYKVDFWITLDLLEEVS